MDSLGVRILRTALYAENTAVPKFMHHPSSNLSELLLYGCGLDVLMYASSGADGARCQHSRLRLTGSHRQARVDPNGLWGLERLRAGADLMDHPGRLGLGDVRAVPRRWVGGYQVEEGQERGTCVCLYVSRYMV